MAEQASISQRSRQPFRHRVLGQRYIAYTSIGYAATYQQCPLFKWLQLPKARPPHIVDYFVEFIRVQELIDRST
jgi:hypothetical protein